MMRSRQAVALVSIISLLLLGAVLVLGLFRFDYRGEMFERHSPPGAPDVEIYSKGFVDSSFDAYLVSTDGRRDLISSSLPCHMKFGEFRTNDRRVSYLTNLISAPALRTKNGAALFEVFWTKDLQQVAISYRGYLVRAYNVRKKQTLSCDTDEVFESRDRCIYRAMTAEDQ